MSSAEMQITAFSGNDTVRFNTILLAQEGSNMNMGSRVFLKAKDSKAEIVSRALTSGEDIISRGHLVGAEDVIYFTSSTQAIL